MPAPKLVMNVTTRMIVLHKPQCPSIQHQVQGRPYASGDLPIEAKYISPDDVSKLTRKYRYCGLCADWAPQP